MKSGNKSVSRCSQQYSAYRIYQRNQFSILVSFRFELHVPTSKAFLLTCYVHCSSFIHSPLTSQTRPRNILMQKITQFSCNITRVFCVCLVLILKTTTTTKCSPKKNKLCVSFAEYASNQRSHSQNVTLIPVELIDFDEHTVCAIVNRNTLEIYQNDSTTCILSSHVMKL